MRRPSIPTDLLIAAAGFLIALLLPLLLEIGTNEQETAIVALTVVLFQGVTIWNLRRSQVRAIDRLRRSIQIVNGAQPFLLPFPCCGGDGRTHEDIKEVKGIIMDDRQVGGNKGE